MLKSGFSLVKKALSVANSVAGPVPWSDNTAFPIQSALFGTDYLVGLHSSTNAKWTVTTLLTYINANASFAPIGFTLQDAYNNSSSPQINGAITFFDGSISSTTVNGSITTFTDTNIPTEGTTYSVQRYVCDTSTAGQQQTYAFSAGLWADSSGDLSGFGTFTVLDDGAPNTLMYMQGAKGSSGPRIGLGGQNSTTSWLSNFSVNLPASSNPFAGSVVQFMSPPTNLSGSMVFPTMPTSGVSSLYVSDNPISLAAYDTDKNVISYYDGSVFQDVLTINHCENGTGMLLTNNGDGTLSFDCTLTLQEAYNNSSSPQIIGDLSFNSTLLLGSGIINPNAIFQPVSTTQGVLDPNWNTSQESTNILSFGSDDVGIRWYNTSDNVFKYWDGADEQIILTQEKVVAADSSVNVSYLSDGTVSLSASGTSGPVTPAFQNYNILNCIDPTSFSGVGAFVPMVIQPGTIYSGDNNNFTLNSRNVGSGKITVSAQYTGAQTKKFNIIYSLALLNTTTAVSNYELCIYRFTANGTALGSIYIMPLTLKDTTTPVEVALAGELTLAQNDSIEIWVRVLGSGAFTSCICNYITFSAQELIGSSLTSTDYLPQGSSNLYLSQDGGTTYQNLSGTATVGHYASYNSTGGQLIDSGVSIGNINANAVTTNSSFYPVFVSSSTGNNQTIDTSTGLSFNPNTNTLTTTTFSGNLSGNATTATTATNANNITTTQVSSNASYYLLMAASSTNSNQAPDLATGLTYNPSTNFLSTKGLVLAGSHLPIAEPTVQINFNGGNYVTFDSISNMGIDNAKANPFWLMNAYYNTTTTTYQYTTSSNAVSGISLNFNSGSLVAAVSGTSGTDATLLTCASWDFNQNFYVHNCSSNNTLVGTGASGQLTTSVSGFSPTFANLSLTSPTSGQLLVANGSSPLTSIAYASTNTASTVVERDSSGNFSASTITAALTGNATTATTATNANNVATTQVSSNASYYILMAASSTNSNQAVDLATGLTYNPSTNVLSTTGLSLSGLTAGSVLFYDASAVSQSNANYFWDNTNDNLYIGANTSTTLDSPGRLVLRGTTHSVTNGSDIIFYNTNDSHPLLQILPWDHDDVHLAFDCYWNGSNWVSSYSSSNFRIYKHSGLNIDYAAVAQGSNITWSTAVTLTTAGNVLFGQNVVLNGKLANGIVTTDGSKNLIPIAAQSSYTPTLGDGTNNFTTTVAQGSYYKIGSLYHVQATITWTGKGSASAGSGLYFTLPANVANASSCAAVVGYSSGISFTGSYLTSACGASTNFLALYGSSNTGTTTQVLVSNASTSGQIFIYATFWSA